MRWSLPTNTGLVYLDMLQQFLIPQLDEDDQEGRSHFLQKAHPPHSLPWTGARVLQHPFIATPVSQVGGVVERRR
jgi:hypothetical protein